MVTAQVKPRTEPIITWKDDQGRVHVSTLSYYQKVMQSGGEITVYDAGKKGWVKKRERPVAVDKIITPEGRTIDFKSGKSDWMPIIYKKTETGYEPAGKVVVKEDKDTASKVARYLHSAGVGTEYYYVKPTQQKTTAQEPKRTPATYSPTFPHVREVSLPISEILRLQEHGRPYTMQTVEYGIPVEVKGVVIDNPDKLREIFLKEPHTYYIWKDESGKTYTTWDKTPEKIDSIAEALFYGYKPKSAEVKYAKVGEDKIPVGVKLVLEPPKKKEEIPAFIDVKKKKVVLPANAPIEGDKVQVTLEEITEKGRSVHTEWYTVERGKVQNPNTTVTVRYSPLVAKAEDWSKAKEMHGLYTYVLQDLRKKNVAPYVAAGFLSWRDPFNLKTIYYGATGQKEKVINLQYEKMKDFYKLGKETKGDMLQFVGRATLFSPTTTVSAGAYALGAGTAGAVGLIGRVSPTAARLATGAVRIGGTLLAASYVAEPAFRKDYAEAFARAGVVAASIPFAYAGAKAVTDRLMPKGRILRLETQAEQFGIQNKGGIYAEFTGGKGNLSVGGRYVANYQIVNTEKVQLPAGTLRRSIVVGDVVGNVQYKTPYGKFNVKVRTPYATRLYDVIPRESKNTIYSLSTTYSKAGEYRGFAETIKASSLLRIGGLYRLDTAVKGQPAGEYYVISHAGILSKAGTSRGIYGRTLLNYVELKPPSNTGGTGFWRGTTFTRTGGGTLQVLRITGVEPQTQATKTLSLSTAQKLIAAGARVVGSRVARSFSSSGAVAVRSGNTLLLLKEKTRTIESARGKTQQRTEIRPIQEEKIRQKEIVRPITLFEEETKQRVWAGLRESTEVLTKQRTKTRTRTRTRASTRTEIDLRPEQITVPKQSVFPTVRQRTKVGMKTALSLKLRALTLESTLFKERVRTRTRLELIPLRFGWEWGKGSYQAQKRTGRGIWSNKNIIGEIRKTLFADYWSVHKSVARYGKATQPLPTPKVWKIAERTRYMRVPTAELLRSPKPKKRGRRRRRKK